MIKHGFVLSEDCRKPAAYFTKLDAGSEVMIITFSLFGSSVFYRINSVHEEELKTADKALVLHLLMMLFGSHQISVNSFGLVLRPRLFSLLSSSLIGVSVLVRGSWIGKVSTCIASTTERTHLKQTKGEDRRCTMKNKTLVYLQLFKS